MFLSERPFEHAWPTLKDLAMLFPYCITIFPYFRTSLMLMGVSLRRMCGLPRHILLLIAGFIAVEVVIVMPLFLRAINNDLLLLESASWGKRGESTRQLGVAKSVMEQRNGIVVLGMHRSGTSLLSGLLVTYAGYNVGDEVDLVPPSYQNAKGFFERKDVIRQNDILMDMQDVTWYNQVQNFDPMKALKQKREGSVNFTSGEEAMAFLNCPENEPWLLKDPRLCLTLPTWLGLIETEPAVVFTYRHPLEVASSVMTRARNHRVKRFRMENFTLGMGLHLWIVYNKNAIQSSKSLCRVVTSNNAILDDPQGEAKRISNELTSKCGVRKAPREPLVGETEKFIDSNLQHSTQAQENESLNKKVLLNQSSCIVYDYPSELESGTIEKARELDLYLMAMKIYCDLQSGTALAPDYQWPHVVPG